MLGVNCASKGSAEGKPSPLPDLKSVSSKANHDSPQSSSEKRTSTQYQETLTAGTDLNNSNPYTEKHGTSRFSGQKLASALFFRPSTFKFRKSSSGGEEVRVGSADDITSIACGSISFSNSECNVSLSSVDSEFTFGSWHSSTSVSAQTQDPCKRSMLSMLGIDKKTAASLSHLGGSLESSPTATSSVGKTKSRPLSGSQRKKVPLPVGRFTVSNNKMARLHTQLHPELIAALDVHVVDSVNPDNPILADSANSPEQTSNPPTVDELHPHLPWPVNSTRVSYEKSTDPTTAKVVVRAATLPILIHFLASEGPVDHEYQEDFLKTFTYFARSKDVGRLLIVRYVNASMSIAAHADRVSSDTQNSALRAKNFLSETDLDDSLDNSTEDVEGQDLEGGDETKAIFAQKRSDWDKAIQARVLGFFKRWLERRPDDFVATDEQEESPDLNSLLRLFLETVVIHNPYLCGFGRGVLEKLDAADATKRSTSLSTNSTFTNAIVSGDLIGSTAKPILPLNIDCLSKPRFSFPLSSSEASSKPSHKIHTRSFSLTSSSSPSDASSLPLSGNSPVYVVEELALLEHAAFREIRLSEVMNQTWLLPASVRDAEAPNLRRFILWFDNVAYGCATEVLRHRDIGIRGSTITALITAARHCLTLRAYNACFEIIAGLGLGPVRRLHKTWDVVPKKYRKEYATVAALVSSGDNHKVYRRRLADDASEKGREGPWVPYLGVNLTDQVFAEDGNTTYLPPSPVESSSLPLINFAKCRLLSRLLTVISEAQRGTYKHSSRPGVLQWITDRLSKPAGEEELYRRSHELEPSIPTKQKGYCSKKDESSLDSVRSGDNSSIYSSTTTLVETLKVRSSM